MPSFVVLGGAGAMGRIIVRDLFEFAPRDARIVVADYDGAKARAVARAYRSPRVLGAAVDVKDEAGCARRLRGAFAVINAVQYQLNLHVMRAALAARAHYIDLGGLFHMTRRQLRLDAGFRRAGRLALLGMGAAPGITNLLARVAGERLDSVDAVHVLVGSSDRTRYSHKPALAVSYSLQTVLEEFSARPAVFARGAFRHVEPMSGQVEHDFPAPVGRCRPMFTLHSEVATLPLSFKEKGVREVTFRIAFDPEVVDRVRFLRDLGFASEEPVRVRGGEVAPIEVANKVAMSQQAPKPLGPLRQYEVLRALVRGRAGGRKRTVLADCHCPGRPEWGVGVDVDTGSPPSIAALMLAEGEIRGAGALPPEAAVPPEPFFRRLRRRGMSLRVSERAGWHGPEA